MTEQSFNDPAAIINVSSKPVIAKAHQEYTLKKRDILCAPLNFILSSFNINFP